MSLENYLIDSTGDLWGSNSWQLRQRYNASRSYDGFEVFLIKNVGFVGLTISSGSVFIKATPALVTYACFSKVSELMSSGRPNRVALSWFNDSWHHEMRRGFVDGRERLMELMLEAEGKFGGSYNFYPRETGNMADVISLAKMLELWRERRGYFDLDEHSDMISKATEGKYTIVRRDPVRRALEFVYFGDSISLYNGKNWKRRLVGCRVDEQPDLEFGRWLADNYLETILCGNPALGDIDATTVDIAAKRSVRKIYTRLALPIQTNEPGEYLLCASAIHDTEVLPFVTP